jgi:hypothetical protein
MLLRWALLAVLLTACGSEALKHAGQSCTASSECGNGLLCNLATHKCAGMGSVDAAIPVDAAKIDARRPIDAPKPIDAAVDAPPD